MAASSGECCGKSIVFGYDKLVTATGTNYYDKTNHYSIHLKKDKPFREYACLWMETNGGKKLSKKIDFEVCGTEQVDLAHQEVSFSLIYHGADQIIGGETFLNT